METIQLQADHHKSKIETIIETNLKNVFNKIADIKYYKREFA